MHKPDVVAAFCPAEIVYTDCHRTVSHYPRFKLDCNIKAGILNHYHEFIADVKETGNYWEVTSLGRSIKRITKAKEIIDCTGNSGILKLIEDRQCLRLDDHAKF